MLKQEQSVKWRMEKFAEELLLEDLFEFCNRLKEACPSLVFFDGRYLGGDEYRCLPKPDLPPRIFGTAKECFGELPVLEYDKFGREPVKIFISRFPWPEEIELGGVAQLGSCSYPNDLRSSEEWRALGRYLRIKFPLMSPDFMPSTQWRFAKSEAFPTPAEVGSAMIIRPGRTLTFFHANYQSNDPDCAKFIHKIKSILNSLLTADIGFYDPLNGSYLFGWAAHFKMKRSKRLMRRICELPNHYVDLTRARCGRIVADGQIAAIGPSPLFKEKVYKELGLPTEGIPGLAEVKAARARKRRREGLDPRR